MISNNSKKFVQKHFCYPHKLIHCFFLVFNNFLSTAKHFVYITTKNTTHCTCRIFIVGTKGAFTLDPKQRKTKVGNFREYSCCTGPPRGGAGGTMTAEPMDFRGPIGFRKTNDTQKFACEDLKTFFFFFGDHLISTKTTVKISVKTFFFLEDHLILTGKTVKILVKTSFFWRSPNFDRNNRQNFGEDLFLFFLEITSFFGPDCSIFSVYFGLHNTGSPSFLSWPRADVWLSAPLSLYTLLAQNSATTDPKFCLSEPLAKLVTG